MDSQLWSVLLGALIASVVPIVTLVVGNRRWRAEKRIEHLRLKYDKLERMYDAILQKLPDELNERAYSIRMMSQISVLASPEVRKLFYDHLDSDGRDELTMKNALFEISVAANRHLAAVDKEIESALGGA
jgi:hypothetical protein